jgi:thioredoxin 1
MRHLTLFVTAFVLLSANDWNLVLKNGKTIACDGVPIIVNDVYMFRDSEGKDATLPADQVDREATDRINKVAPAPRQWRMIGESVHESPSATGVLTFKDADFESQVLQSSTPVLVDFWATWCGFCRKIEPSMASIASEYGGRLKVGKLDIDKNPDITRRYGVVATPTLLLFDQGRVVGTIHGAAGKSAIIQMLAASMPAR